MKRMIFTEKEIIRIVEQHLYADQPAEVLCKKHRIRPETLERWCSLYGLITWAELFCEVQVLRKENRSLKKLIADLPKPTLN